MIRVDSIQTKNVVSLERLMAMPIAVPEIQRSIDEDVVAAIVAFQRQRFAAHKSLLFLGDLVLAECGQSFNLVDGQHRYAALKEVYLLQPDYTVSLLIVHLDHTLTLEHLFVLLNKSQPVPSYVIENTLDLNKRAVLETFDKLFRAEFKTYVSKSTSPRKPNVSLAAILDVVQQPTCPALRTLVTAHKLFDYMKWINVTRCKALAMKCPRTLQACITKAHPDEGKVLFLCTDRDHDWLHATDLMDAFLAHRRVSQPTVAPAPGSGPSGSASGPAPASHTPPQPRRAPIPKRLRMIVWKREFGNVTEGRCVCCLQPIQIDCFEAGHVVSEAMGGSCHAANLKPTCGQCNRSMGKRNMNEFAREFFGRELE
jgi:hypothetical protein